MKSCAKNPVTAIEASQGSGVLWEIYFRLSARYGPQGWWPAKTKFEVIVGAILTQNTNWGNVEKALANLRRRGWLNAPVLRDLSLEQLAAAIKPSGYFNIKARRLKNFIDFFFQEYNGRLGRMAREPLEKIRSQLLSVKGIGPETADSILLYALDQPVFVVDAYTKRVLSRHYLIPAAADYHDVQEKFMAALPADVEMFNEYHALIVRVGKEFCKSESLCEGCPLNNIEHCVDK